MLISCAVLLLGCNTPSPAFRGVEPVRITVGQSTFDVRVNGNRAEAIRLNKEWAPRLEAVAPRAVAAIEKVSGCTVYRTGGDAALILARLKCDKGAVPVMPPERVEYDCDIEDAYGHRDAGVAGTDMTCTQRRF
nr:hypothetical protein [Aquicoccus sp. G2-2]MEA1115177.1 hypothetical protein [Aquicoccus sp. G2-2]